MLRRPPTAIELTLDDIREYEHQKMAKEQEKGFGESANLGIGPKSKEEIHARIGYAPKKPAEQRTHN